MGDMFGFEPTNELVLRDYQERGLNKLRRAIANGARAPLFVAPTGSGKTSWAAFFIKSHVEKGGRVLFMAPRRELIHQASNRLRECGLYHGVVLAGEAHLSDPSQPVQVASIDTLVSRMVRKKQDLGLGDFSLIIVDEAHLSITEVRKELLGLWPQAIVVGLTATPIRKDGRALGMMYDTLVEATSVKQLTDEGYLCKARYFSLTEPDLRKVRTTAGDYNQKQLDEAVNQAELVGDIAQHWLELASDRRTVVFCTSIAHSIAVQDEFLRLGIAAEHVDAQTPSHERQDIFARFTSGQTQILTNCFLASYGFDLPELSCVVLARPTKSLMLYLQMLGRGLRTAEGKEDCLVLDHSGSVHLHGFATDEREWTLDGTKTFGDRSRSRHRSAKTPATIDCPECSAVFSRTLTCPECGYRIKPPPEAENMLDGKLVEIGANGNFQRSDPRFYAELKGFAIERGYKIGWAAWKYKERFGSMPPKAWSDDQPMEPTVETRRWIKSRQIAYAKAKQKAEATG